MIAGVKLVLGKFFTNSECPFPQVAGDKRKRVTSIKEEEEEEEDGEGGKPVKKRSSQAGASNQSLQFLLNYMLLPPGCKCKSGCKTKACSCRKAGPYCTSLCRCNPNKCSNR